MNPKTRIMQFVESQSISLNAFSKKIGVSNSYFSNDSAIGSDKLLKIFSAYPELNMDWVITGRGEMLNGESMPPKEKDWKAEYEKLLKDYKELSDDYRAAVKEKDKTKPDVAIPRDVHTP